MKMNKIFNSYKYYREDKKLKWKPFFTSYRILRSKIINNGQNIINVIGAVDLDITRIF